MISKSWINMTIMTIAITITTITTTMIITFISNNIFNWFLSFCWCYKLETFWIFGNVILNILALLNSCSFNKFLSYIETEVYIQNARHYNKKNASIYIHSMLRLFLLCFHTQFSTLITSTNSSRYYINTTMIIEERKWDYRLTEDAPYLQAKGVLLWEFRGSWSPYNHIAL